MHTGRYELVGMPGLINKFQNATRSRFKKGIASKIYALHDRMEAERRGNESFHSGGGSFHSTTSSSPGGGSDVGPGGDSSRLSTVESGFGIDGRRVSTMATAGVARVNRSTLEAVQAEEEKKSKSKRRLSITAGLGSGSKDGSSAAKALTKTVGANASKIASSVRRKSVSMMGTSPGGGEGSVHAGRASPSSSFASTSGKGGAGRRKDSDISNVLTAALGGLVEKAQQFGAEMGLVKDGAMGADGAGERSDASSAVHEWLRQQMVSAGLRRARAACAPCAAYAACAPCATYAACAACAMPLALATCHMHMHTRR